MLTLKDITTLLEEKNHNLALSFKCEEIEIDEIKCDNNQAIIEIVSSEEDDNSLMNLQNKIGFSKTCKRKRDRNKLYTCVLCNASMKRKSVIINHYTMHKEEKVKENMKLIEKNVDMLTCCICMEKFTSKDLLYNHNSFHTEYPLLCIKCNKSFKPHDFLAHMRSHYKDELLKCNLCGFLTSSSLKFDDHVKNYHNCSNSFFCDKCDERFQSKRILLAHKTRMHLLEQCKVCKKRFADIENLEVHQKQHVDSKIRICDVCGKSISNQSHFAVHKRIHTGSKPYKCTECGHSVRTKYSLTEHMRVHTGEKPYECDVCGKRFTQSSPLKIHKRCHTGERPYVCHICNEGFVSKGTLGMHLKIKKH